MAKLEQVEITMILTSDLEELKGELLRLREENNRLKSTGECIVIYGLDENGNPIKDEIRDLAKDERRLRATEWMNGRIQGIRAAFERPTQAMCELLEHRISVATDQVERDRLIAERTRIYDESARVAQSDTTGEDLNEDLRRWIRRPMGTR